MRLERGFGGKVEQPSDAQLEETLRDLPGGESSFAILIRSEGSYIQVLGGRESGYILEYQDGSLDNHHVCQDADLDIDAVVRAFQSYAHGDDDWRTSLRWQRQELNGGRWLPSKISPGHLFTISAIAMIVLPPLVGLALLLWTSIDAGELVRGVAAIEMLPLVLGGTVGLFWLAGKRRARIRNQLAERGIRIEGVLTNVRTTIGRDEERVVPHHAVRYRYDTPTGTRVRRQSVGAKTLHGVSIGDLVTVTYDPQRTGRALPTFRYQPRRTRGVVPRPATPRKGQRLDLQSIALPSLGIAFGAVALLTMLEIVFRGDKGLAGTLSSALLCRAPVRMGVWSVTAGLGLVLLRPAIRRDRTLAPYREQIGRYLRWEPRSRQTVVACPYCGREILPGTGRCAYCCLQVNAGRRRAGFGLLLFLGSVVSTGFWAGVARDAHALDGLTLSFAGMGAALWLLYTGIAEWYWWHRLRRRGRSTAFHRTL
jgi:hypothetical protein